MAKKINENAVLLELSRRVMENENGVRNYLETAGIHVNGKITLDHLNMLRELNLSAFDKMLNFLYPEMKQYANADEPAGMVTQNGNKWSAGDWTSMVGTILNGAVGILGGLNINGNTDAQAQAEMLHYMSEQEAAAKEKKQMRNTIIIVCVGFVVIVVAGVLIFKHRK